MASAEAIEVVEPVLGLEMLAPDASLLTAEDETLLEVETLVEEALVEDETLLVEETLLEDEIFDTLEEVARFWMIAD